METLPLPPVPAAAQKRGSAVAVLLLIVAFVVFSWGIWKARVGFGDDTVPVLSALEFARAGEYPRNLYTLAYTLLLRWVTPDPVSAALVMRTAVSLLSTLALFYILTAFRAYVRRTAGLIACAVWMASHLNSPLVQYSNLSPFTFSIAALGLGWLLRRWSWSGFCGFMVAVAVAVSLRPEYLAPASLIGGVSGLTLLWQTVRPRVRPGVFWAGLAVAAVLIVVALAPRLRGGGSMDRYLLFGLGQCYATFYKAEHPDAALHPMTEYQPLLDETFGHPTSFFGAIAHNPREAFRYFALNSLSNLRQLPPALLSTRQTMAPTNHLAGRLHALFLLAALLIGGALLLRCVFASARSAKTLGRWRQEHVQQLRQLALVALFCSASSAAILMLVPSPRYWISWVPLIYLTVAACFEALLRLPAFAGRAWLLGVPAFVLFCRPLFLHLGPNENHEVTALRHIVPKLSENPVIAGIYTRPYQAYAFRGHAVSVNAGADLSADGVRTGQYDVLIVDEALRTSRVWSEDAAFFAAFEADPATLGYVKLTEAFTGRRDIYYRPRATAQP